MVKPRSTNMTARRRFDDDKDDDEVKDGESVRRNMLAWDGAPHAVRSGTYDGGAFDSGLHRPGFRYASDEQRAAADRAYEKMVADASVAWKTPRRTEDDRERDCIAARDE